MKRVILIVVFIFFIFPAAAINIFAQEEGKTDKVEELVQQFEYAKIRDNAVAILRQYNDTYHRKIWETIRNPDLSKYSEFELTVYAYMQARWDRYERIYGTKPAELRIFRETSRKFQITQEETKEIFHKVDNTIQWFD